MLTAHFKKLRLRADISAEEEQAIKELVAEVRPVREDALLVRAGQPLNSSLLLLKGWVGRVKDLPGGERQVTELHVPGDFIDIHGFTLGRLEHDVIALSAGQVAVIPHERIRALFGRMPRLGLVYWLMTNIDGAIQGEMALSLGQRSALGRMAHLFCELNRRLRVVGLSVGNSYEFPLTQRELSECLGLTVVHANRTLQELRRRGLIDLESRRLTIRDLPGLEGLAAFDPAYLYLGKHHI